ncbi:hypothetical protein DFH09DRAFT_1136988 [Mycena vulgaris]|nr:hypothetical protein DFH09DRAFT_1136988 [Mycena vulgaris]
MLNQSYPQTAYPRAKRTTVLRLLGAPSFTATVTAASISIPTAACARSLHSRSTSARARLRTTRSLRICVQVHAAAAYCTLGFRELRTAVYRRHAALTERMDQRRRERLRCQVEHRVSNQTNADRRSNARRHEALHDESHNLADDTNGAQSRRAAPHTHAGRASARRDVVNLVRERGELLRVATEEEEAQRGRRRGAR